MNYLEQLGEKLQLFSGVHEKPAEYQWRILLSVISDWMQTAVHTGDDTTSVVHVKQVGMEKLRAFQDMQCVGFPIDNQAVVNYIYETLLENGAFLHRSHNVRPAPHRLIGDSAYAIVRGMCPEEKVDFSGLAPYVQQRVEPIQIEAMFDLPSTSPEQITALLWKRGIPAPSTTNMDAYLDVERTAGRQYYCLKPPKCKGLRYGYVRNSDAQHDYYLMSDNETRRIGSDYTDVHFHEYARLYLMTQNRTQQVTACYDGDNIVHLRFDFHLPYPDLRFMRYIAWPDKCGNLDDAWNFCIARKIWPLLRTRLEFLNYKVVETYA